MKLTISKDTLLINDRTKLIQVSQNSFRIKGWSGQIKINDLSNGKTELINSRNETYIKVEEWTPNKEELSNFEGDYWSDELETVYHLIVKEKNLTIQHRWLGEVSLEPIANDFFKTDWGFYVKFDRNKEGDISSLKVNSGRTLNVVFYRKE